MFLRAVLWSIRRYVKGPGRSWIYTMLATWGWRQVKKRTAKTALIDTQSLKPGTRLMIEHLPVSHRKQIKAEKRAGKAAEAEAKMARKAEKVAVKAEKREAQAAKAEYRHASRQRRRAKARAVAQWGATRVERRLEKRRGGTARESNSA